MKATNNYMGQSNSTVYQHRTPPLQYQLDTTIGCKYFYHQLISRAHCNHVSFIDELTEKDSEGVLIDLPIVEQQFPKMLLILLSF